MFNKISRRYFLGVVAAAAMPAYAQRRQTWFETVSVQAFSIVTAILRHPFVTSLAAGTLPRENFLYYLVQTAALQEAYQKTLALLASRMLNPDHVSFLVTAANDSVRAYDWTKATYIEHAGHPLSASPWKEPSPTTLMYSGHQARTAQFMSRYAGFAGVLPCYWIYQEVGRHIAKTAKFASNPYKDWILTIADAAQAQKIQQAIDVGNELADSTTDELRERMDEAFNISCRLEWMFFEAAWNLQSWPRFNTSFNLKR